MTAACLVCNDPATGTSDLMWHQDEEGGPITAGPGVLAGAAYCDAHMPTAGRVLQPEDFPQ